MKGDQLKGSIRGAGRKEKGDRHRGQKDGRGDRSNQSESGITPVAIFLIEVVHKYQFEWNKIRS